MDLSKPLTQEEFGRLVGITQQAIEQKVAEGILRRGALGCEWLLSYCDRLREQAAGRNSDESRANTIANTKLAEEKVLGQQIKNAISLKQYAPVSLLTEVLSGAASAAATHLDSIVPTLMREGIELTDSQRTRVSTIVARARNELVEKATDLALLDLIDADDDDADSAVSSDGPQDEPLE